MDRESGELPLVRAAGDSPAGRAVGMPQLNRSRPPGQVLHPEEQAASVAGLGEGGVHPLGQAEVGERAEVGRQQPVRLVALVEPGDLGRGLRGPHLTSEASGGGRVEPVVEWGKA